MTPQLQQAIRLLQLSNIELGLFVETELERNPLLERDETEPEPPEEAPRREETMEEDGEGTWETQEHPAALNGAATQATAEANGLELNGRDGDHRLGEQSDWASVRPNTHNGGTGEAPNLEEFVAAGGSLADHLTEQLHLAVTDPAERLIGVHLIHMVDEAGYLQGSLDEVAAKLGASEGLAAKVLATLQGFDPPGVFARNLAECLAL
ncbi:MAG TPA: RNA polymerase sigma-54 factor, partial [Hyphomicrobiaceae bacterium]|nr:RNA polymerase sigma-54 factor [Hyphomicrobiaceae bacterium]